MNGATILNVDDSPDDVLLLSLACRAAKVSFRFQSVDTGAKAIAYLQGANPFSNRDEFPVPDLILLDLKMPGLSGFDVLSWIRNQPDFQQMPVIIFTCSVHANDRIRALELGAQQFLVKPVSYVELQRLAHTLDRLITSERNPDFRLLQT